MVDSKRVVLIITNALTSLVWLRVLFVYAYSGFSSLSDDNNDVCEATLRPALFWALGVSTIELATAVLGFTRSNPLQVLLFASVRTGTELLVTPLIGCGSWQHLFTAFCWSLGEVVRFGCFTADGLVPNSRMAKSIRYSVGPLLFPLGAGGEMFMVISAAATQKRPIYFYLAAMLWPAGFYPLMKQLLKQRRKHFFSTTTKGKPEIKQV
jgi:hypothetical protein